MLGGDPREVGLVRAPQSLVPRDLSDLPEGLA